MAGGGGGVYGVEVPVTADGQPPLVPIASRVRPACLARSMMLTTRPCATPLSALSTTCVVLSRGELRAEQVVELGVLDRVAGDRDVALDRDDED